MTICDVCFSRLNSDNYEIGLQGLLSAFLLFTFSRKAVRSIKYNTDILGKTDYTHKFTRTHTSTEGICCIIHPKTTAEFLK